MFPSKNNFAIYSTILLFFNMENILFQVVLVERFHSITPYSTSCYTFGIPRGGGGVGAQYVKVRDAPRKI